MSKFCALEYNNNYWQVLQYHEDCKIVYLITRVGNLLATGIVIADY